MAFAQLKVKDGPWEYAEQDGQGRQQDREKITQQFLKSLAFSGHNAWPYDYWVLDHALPEFIIDALTALPFTVRKNKDFSQGTRESNNAFRVYFTPENQERIGVCRAVADAFKDERILDRIEKMTGRSLEDGHLRIEYCQDTNGFWLEPHIDVSVKLFSMIIYLSDDSNLRGAGTDIYDSSEEHNHVGTIPYSKGKAMFFMPGFNTWHGFSRRPIYGVRKSLIVNYVSSDWRNTWELA